jgi:Ca2+-binding EF-hand superfamily protein
MRRHFAFIIGTIALQVTLGCNRNDVATPTAARVSDVRGQPSVTTTASKMEQVKITEAKNPIPVKKEPTPASIKPSVDREKQTKPFVSKPERAAILAPGGPIVVDLVVAIDGRPHANLFDDVINQVLKAADSDKDGHPTWRELANSKDYLERQGANASSDADRQLKSWLEQYDRNHDGEIQRDEAASWLGRDAGVTARAFDARGTRSYAAVPSATSRIWKLLDIDHDNRLSKVEIARAPATLLSLDANDDGMITPEELVPLREQLRVDGERGSTFNTTANPYAAIYLEPQYELDRLEYILTDVYAAQQVLRPESFSSLLRAYKELDTDGDDQLTQDELIAMRSMKPQLKLAVDFGTQSAKHFPKVAVLEHASEIEIVQQPAPDRLILRLGTTRMIVVAQDRSPGATSPMATSGSEIRMIVHDQSDSLGEVLDSDSDGKLGEHEIATSAERLLKFDTNADGQISNEELPYYMIVAIVRGERPGEQSLYRPVSGSQLPATSDAPSWFAHADFNGDGYISRREFLGTADQFSSLDQNRDGFISNDEAKNATNLLKKSGR